MSLANLSIAGVGLNLTDKFRPRWSSRKFYNASYFHDDTYRHEVANHYRDYKERARMRGKRIRKVFVRYRRPACVDECRDLLPVTVLNFPRFADVYTPRGRQTLFNREPPDETYNDTVRRIRAADTCEQLKVLVQRQLDLRSSEERRRSRRHGSWRRTGGGARHQKCAINDDDSDGNRRAEGDRRQQEVKPEKWYKQHGRNYAKENYLEQRNNSQDGVAAGGDSIVKSVSLRLGNLKSVTCKGKRQHQQRRTKPHASDQAANLSDDKLAPYYLQLAACYYEQGFLKNIQYLESIGSHNNIKRQQRSATSAIIATNSGGKNTTNAETVVTLEPRKAHSRTAVAEAARIAENEQAVDETVAAPQRSVLSGLLQRIGRKRSFRVAARNKEAKREQSAESSNWGIRVNITRATGTTAAATEIGTGTGAARSKALQHQQHSRFICKQSRWSMNDYLNADAQTISSERTTIANKRDAANNGLNLTTVQANVHQLIDNLMQLEITADVDAQLPKITLTDCSTPQTATAANEAAKRAAHFELTYAADSVQLGSKQAAEQIGLPRARTDNCYKLKQSKLDFNNGSLDIPNEQIIFQREARPP